jgi:hypothetical protein
MAPLLIGPRCNRRVTCDSNPNNDRSESAIAADANNPYHLIGSSKKFTDPQTYAFSLAPYASVDGGQSWVEGIDAATNGPLQLLAGWAGTSDPAVAWDDAGKAFLIGLAFGPGLNPALLGLAAYTSTDYGRTWSLPNFFYQAFADKQGAAGDMNPASPHHGNVYVVWDGGNGLSFARTLDHGATWIGTGASPAGSSLSPTSFAPDVFVAQDGTVYVVFFVTEGGNTINFVKSTDGGNSFSAPAAVATAVTAMPFKLAGGTFRNASIAVGCVGQTSSHVLVAWPDFRNGITTRIFFVYSNNGGTSWHGGASGQQLLTGAVASAGDQHEIQPQLASTPDGTIGCAFYQFGPKTPGGNSLIDVVLAAARPPSGRGGVPTFGDRVNVTDQPWDPAVDAPWAHGQPGTTFIGDYFGLTASRLGFHPLWLDTRTLVQEMFTSRLAVNPCDVYMRDSNSDTGSVPSPGNHWEAPDLIVRRQADGFVNFVDQDLLRDGVTDHYVYARVKAAGPNDGRNVTVAVTVGNYPSLMALPGAEFRYPQDWYPDDWTTAAIQGRHFYVGETPAVATLASGSTQIVGPIVWHAADIPPEGTWHPCLLAEVRADNDDSAGGLNGCGVDADPVTCDYGEYFWGNNNVCQRNLSYAPVPPFRPFWVHLPFLVGSPYAPARSLAVIVERDPELAEIPMTLRMVRPPREEANVPEREREPVSAIAEVRVIEGRVVERLERHARVIIEERETDVTFRRAEEAEPEEGFGGERTGRSSWRLTHQRAVVGFPVRRGEVRALVLSFETPRGLEPGSRPQVRIFQRNARHVITGSVTLELQVEDEE